MVCISIYAMSLRLCNPLFGLAVPDRLNDWEAFLDNRIAKRIAKTVMEKTGIVKRIDKKIVQQVILSNCFCLRYPLQYTCSYSFTCLPNIQNTARTA